MNKYISNAFSLQMLKANATISVTEIGYDAFKKATKDAHSVIGHKDLANMLNLKFNRESIELNVGDILYVAQVIGGRLPEGCTSLPDGIKLKFLKVAVWTPQPL